MASVRRGLGPVVRKIENIILILAALGIVAATSLSGWMNKKAQAAPQPAVQIMPPAPASPKAGPPTNNYYYYAPQNPEAQKPKLQRI